MYEEKTIHSKKIYDGKILDFRVDKVKLHNGQESYREIISHPGGCAIVANHNGKIIFVKQFRKPIERELLELPAGKLDEGEDPCACAKRELQEETGYIANQIEKIGQMFTSPGYSNEVIHIYYSDNVTLDECNPDENEFVDVVEIEVKEVYNMIISGEICDGKTQAGIMLALEHLKI